jgi:polar amino acid transport system substrate-binding protein
MFAKQYLLPLALLSSLLSPLAHAQSISIVTSQWVPYVDYNQKDKGLAVELVTTALERKGYQPNISIDDWPRALEGLKLGLFDASCAVWKSTEREEELVFSEPYLRNKISFIKKKSLKLNYNRLGDLRGYLVGVVRDYAYGDEFLKSRDLIKVSSNHIVQNLIKLNEGKIDLTLGDERAVNHELNKFFPNGIAGFEFVDPPLVYKNLYFAVSKLNKSAKKIISDFNQSIKEMKKDGSYAKILKKYDFGSAHTVAH